jgi:hypothetical protein
MPYGRKFNPLVTVLLTCDHSMRLWLLAEMQLALELRVDPEINTSRVRSLR